MTVAQAGGIQEHLYSWFFLSSHGLGTGRISHSLLKYVYQGNLWNLEKGTPKPECCISRLCFFSPSSPTLLLFQILMPSFVLPDGLSTRGSLCREALSLFSVKFHSHNEKSSTDLPASSFCTISFYFLFVFWTMECVSTQNVKNYMEDEDKSYFSIHSRCPRSNSSSFSWSPSQWWLMYITFLWFF